MKKYGKKDVEILCLRMDKGSNWVFSIIKSESFFLEARTHARFPQRKCGFNLFWFFCTGDRENCLVRVLGKSGVNISLPIALNSSALAAHIPISFFAPFVPPPQKKRCSLDFPNFSFFSVLCFFWGKRRRWKENSLHLGLLLIEFIGDDVDDV